MSRNEAECPICAEPFVEPRQLPCCHVYCVECLERWVANDGQLPRLTCPTCRTEFQLPEHGSVHDLPFPEPDFDDDDDDLDLSDFEIVAETWLDNQPSVEQVETSDFQTDNPWVALNAGDVMDDVINRNISASNNTSDSGSLLDNEVRMNTVPDEPQQNERENDVAEVRGIRMVDESVGAITLLNNELYAALNNSRQIHVYHVDDLQFVRCLAVNGLGAQVYGLAACLVAERLYVSDWDNDQLHSVPLTADNDDNEEDSASWDVANQPAGLSFSLSGPPNVLVACHGAGKIQEWSPDGILIRQIQLPDELRLVWHAVPLADTEIVVSHEGSQHRVVVVSTENGQVLHSCGQVDAVQLQYPRSVVVDRTQGRVVIADQCNNRIITAQMDLTGARELEVNLNQGLAWPYGLHMDQNRRRLYLTEWNHGRILRVDIP